MSSMTPVSSVLSTRSNASPKSVATVADVAVVKIGHVYADMKSARVRADHPIWIALAMLTNAVCSLTQKDAVSEGESYSPPDANIIYTHDAVSAGDNYNPATEEDIPAGWADDCADDVSVTKDPAPAIQNDITLRRNSFCVELASRVRMTRKDVETFVGKGWRDILSGLVGDGTITETPGKRGRGGYPAGYSLTTKTETPVNPAPVADPTLIAAESLLVTSVVLATYGADQDTLNDVDAQSSDGLASYRRKGRMPKSQGAAHFNPPVADPSPTVQTEEIPAGWADDCQGEPTTPVTPQFPCKNCGKDIGMDAPSGACSTDCLNAAQGFTPPAPTTTPSADATGAAILIIRKAIVASKLSAPNRDYAAQLLNTLASLLASADTGR